MDQTYFTREMPVYEGCPWDVFVNQIGYFPKQEKCAVIRKSAQEFYLVKEDGEKVFTGQTEYFGVDKNSQDEIWIASFTEFEQEGNYHIETDSGLSSTQFCIAKDCYKTVFHDLMRAYYYLRCGEKLDKEHAGKFAHEICHQGMALEWGNESVRLDVTGGWHDAGDYGRYVNAGACALGHLLYAYELFPETFVKTKLEIPDATEKIPDILTECRHELEWILKMQKADGGVYHKATTVRHAPFVMPEEDLEQLYVFPVSSMCTADFAAIMAKASTVYREFDEAFADRMLEAAKLSYQWLTANPDYLGFANPPECNTGQYEEADDADNRFWASAELYAATGEEQYQEQFKAMYQKEFSKTAFSWNSIGGMGSLSYLLCKQESKDETMVSALKQAFVNESERLKNLADSCGYGVAMADSDYRWGSNMTVMCNAMTFIITDLLSGNAAYQSYASRQFDYLLGVNATGYSYVTEEGAFCCKRPHYRPVYAAGVEDECVPGFVSGGANGIPCDPDALILVPKHTPPMKCFVDDIGCYSLNEITIYWNSPAVFVNAYLNSKIV